jgi:hypothetical protein
MIGIMNLAVVTQSAILLAGVWIVLFWLWPAVRLDCFRQRMFEVRDELFDYAASGKIAFEHPAYRLLRQSMNGFIRYGHKVSFCQFIMTWLTWKAMEGSESFKWEKKWQAALATLSNETRSDLLQFQQRSTAYVTERIVLGSPVLVLSLLISVIAVLCHMGWKSARQLMLTALSETAARAIDQRILDEEAARAAA